MKKLLLLFALAFFISCGSAGDYITVTGYEWKVTLKNGDYATGVTATKKEAEIKIANFANNRKTGIKKDHIKTINRKIKKSKF